MVDLTSTVATVYILNIFTALHLNKDSLHPCSFSKQNNRMQNDDVLVYTSASITKINFFLGYFDPKMLILDSYTE